MMIDITALSDDDLLAMLTTLKPSDEAVAKLAASLADEWLAAAVELRKRSTGKGRAAEPMVRESVSSPRFTGANTVHIDPDRWSAFWVRRRTPLNQVGPLFNRCEGWASVIKKKAHAGYYALDDLACAIGMRVDDLIAEVGAPSELERLCIGQL